MRDRVFCLNVTQTLLVFTVNFQGEVFFKRSSCDAQFSLVLSVLFEEEICSGDLRLILFGVQGPTGVQCDSMLTAKNTYQLNNRKSLIFL